MAELRTVTGTVLKPDGTPWRQPVLFQLTPGSFDADAMWPLHTVRAYPDASGNFSVELWANEGGESETAYVCTLPSRETFQFTVPITAGPFTLSALREAGLAVFGAQFPTTAEFYAYDIGTGRLEGKPAASELLLHFVAVRPFSFPAALADSEFIAEASATAEAVFSVQLNDVEFGTITVAAAGTTGTFAAATETDFVAGDVLKIVAPASQDATLSDIAITLKGTLA